MRTVRTVADLRASIGEWRRAGETVALIPTMGALHEGHLSLVRLGRVRCRRTVATLFVNPKQFNRSDDLAAYPRTEAADAEKLDGVDCDLLFAPGVAEMYPAGFATGVSVRGVGEVLEGAARPGHFDGVATVVSKLLLQSLPDCAIFGEKDWQQLQVIRRFVADLDIPVTIEGAPTVREADGLALSSRNVRLTPAQRILAPLLHRTMQAMAEAVRAGSDAEAAGAEARRALEAGGFSAVDYVELRDGASLGPPGDGPRRILAAAWLGDVRLIDNLAV
ncbi:MAG: pantoate--beta-alanine ligase [Alphaproteobacteria bacterium]